MKYERSSPYHIIPGGTFQNKGFPIQHTNCTFLLTNPSIGTFDQTTNTDENAFIANSVLVLKPTLQDPNFVINDTFLDLRHDGCTGRLFRDCVATTNITNGTIVPPVRSGRVNTRLGATIQYGRVEVTARLPSGDWLWPTIALLPAQSIYGDWPQSGGIDIMQSRGNNHSYVHGGNDVVASCLHFGPDQKSDGWWRNFVKSKAHRGTFTDKFHRFGVEVSILFLYVGVVYFCFFCFRGMKIAPSEKSFKTTCVF